jgi:hypothetical protein
LHMKGVSEMNKKLLIFKRKKAKELHEKGWSNRKIARHILASKNSVVNGCRWMKAKYQPTKEAGKRKNRENTCLKQNSKL